MTDKECTLVTNKHILICIDEEIGNLNPKLTNELAYVKNNFCGIVFSNMKSFNDFTCSPDAIVYLCGDVNKNFDAIKNKIIFVVKEFSSNYDNNSTKYKVISSLTVPINIHTVGVFFRKFFDIGNDYFDLISNEHQFQTLTESNKVTNAFRKGIYLTKVTENNGEFKFKLLRCSSNLNGPTDNFRKTDNEVIEAVNAVSDYFFDGRAEFNHVLAQIYENKSQESDGKKVDKKAKIKQHSDKTKDFPRNGLIAFCTFYQNSKNNYDTSALTKLRFRLKDMVTDPKLIKKFDVILYPNSVFIISLLMNRLYTHEIVPSSKPVDQIPTRLGYVIRCSKTDAVYKDNQTYIQDGDNYVKLEEPDDEGVHKLKGLYYKENMTDEMMHYGKFHFSLNKGDYMKPNF